ncbi:hypothetical protein M513_10060, partial [Trichuris suis]
MNLSPELSAGVIDTVPIIQLHFFEKYRLQSSIHGYVPVRSHNEHEENEKTFILIPKRNSKKNNFGEAFGSFHEPSSAQASVGHQPSRASGGSFYASPTHVAPVSRNFDRRGYPHMDGLASEQLLFCGFHDPVCSGNVQAEVGRMEGLASIKTG